MIPGPTLLISLLIYRHSTSVTYVRISHSATFISENDYLAIARACCALVSAQPISITATLTFQGSLYIAYGCVRIIDSSDIR
jgi:hypothetical protein